MMISLIFVGKISSSNKRIKQGKSFLALIFGHHMPSPFNGRKGEPPKFPRHAANLIVIFMDSSSPPLSPRFFNR
jgi:hypothetical protein